jgi:hypothetical protein
MQPFTADRDALRAAIARFTPGTDAAGIPPLQANLVGDLRLLMAMSPQPVNDRAIWSRRGSTASRRPPRPTWCRTSGVRDGHAAAARSARRIHWACPRFRYRIAAGRGFDFMAVRSQRSRIPIR